MTSETITAEILTLERMSLLTREDTKALSDLVYNYLQEIGIEPRAYWYDIAITYSKDEERES